MKRGILPMLTVTILVIAAASLLFPDIPSPIATVTATPAKDTVTQPGENNHHNVGARTCASSTCHGSPKPDTEHPSMIRRDEYFTWLEKDPHARAFDDLDSPLGKQIFEKLGLTRDGKVPAVSQQLYNTVYNNCLQCHATAIGPESDSAAGSSELIFDGVSCEACHGSASQWRTTHYTDDFIDLPTADKQSLGMTDTENIWKRTSLCVSCHVGSPEAEVNHDLIAAGHPELKFEMTAYASQMPAHWKIRPEPTKDATNRNRETHLWLAGQVSSATAALNQLDRRATLASQSTPHAVWPELSESNCYACHHDLDHTDNWRPSITGQKPLLPVNDWYLASLFTLANEDQNQGNAAAGEFCRAWQQLQTSLEKTLAPNPQTVAAHCRQTLAALHTWIDSDSLKHNGPHPHYSRIRIMNIMKSAISSDDLNRIMENWDRATQTYLALFALASTYNEHGEPHVHSQSQLLHVRDLLAFPHQTDTRFSSPRNFKGDLSGTDVPENNRMQIRDQLLHIIQELHP
ncbi:MAG: multiheme c-type cytochrome [Planctomycetota bacterium]|nr:multiheme c-type cytochrome [Planctomycetota bacterium]